MARQTSTFAAILAPGQPLYYGSSAILGAIFLALASPLPLALAALFFVR